MRDITVLLQSLQSGDQAAAAQLLPLVYEELRRQAAEALWSEPTGNTLQPTALVHEAYVRLVGEEDEPKWNHRGHFFGAAANAMRQILVESARRRNSLKRGGDYQRVPLPVNLAAEQNWYQNMLRCERIALSSLNRKLVVAESNFCWL